MAGDESCDVCSAPPPAEHKVRVSKDKVRLNAGATGPDDGMSGGAIAMISIFSILILIIIIAVAVSCSGGSGVKRTAVIPMGTASVVEEISLAGGAARAAAKSSISGNFMY